MTDGWERIAQAARANERSWAPPSTSVLKGQADGPRSLHKQGGMRHSSGPAPPPVGTQRFTMYRTAEIDRTMGRTQAPLDKSQLLVDGRVQDMCAESGAKRNTAGSIPDQGPHINTNILRFQRQQNPSGKLAHDGGWTYTPQVCVGNWTEERQEPGYASGFHARELGFTKLYESEHTAAFRPLTREYRQRIVDEQLVARRPQLRPPVENGNHSDGHYVYYATRGFGPRDHMDHTAASKRGAYWVGNAPPKKHETITMTMHQQQPLEFQQRNSVFDPKAKLLGDHPQDRPESMAMQRTMKVLHQSQQHTGDWKSMYSTEFKDRSRRAQTARPGALQESTWLGVTVRPTTSLH